MNAPAAPVASERFARHALETRFENLSADAVAQAKIFILDTVGVGIAGSSAAGSDELSRVGAGWGESAEASRLGPRQKGARIDCGVPQWFSGALPRV
jgi:2-methylcitrate dehydratase PrpD